MEMEGQGGYPPREDWLQPEWLSATSERICSGRLSPGCTGTDQEADLSQRGAQDAAAQGGASFEAAGSLEEVSQAGQLPKRLLWEHKLACHASPHAAEDGSWTCPTCGDCFDDSDVDQ